jgi:GNAT superfamily N-acetyltransferase
MEDSMSGSRLRIYVDEHPKPDDAEAVRAGLREHNRRQLPGQEWRNLAVYLRDSSDTIRGGVLAEVGWGWLHISVLWVDEGVRGHGYGVELLAAAEAEARRAGCGRVFLDTFSFQARPFYERNGYEVFGVLEDFPPGHERYFLRKSLDSVAALTTVQSI